MTEDLERIEGFFRRHPTTVAPPIRAEALAGDVSSRRYYRARDSQERSWILTLYPASFRTDESALDGLKQAEARDPDAALSYANHPLAQLEMSQFLSEQGLPVPRLLGAEGDLGVVAFEDLGDVRLIEALNGCTTAERHAWYRQAVDLIVDLQGATDALLHRSLVGSQLAFTHAKLMWEMEYFIRAFFEDHRRSSITAVQGREIRSVLEPLCGWLAHRPRVLCHRDYHARNLMVVGSRLVLIDYQDARLGPMTYDLVSLLLDPYAPPLRDLLDGLFQHYCDRKKIHHNTSIRQEWHGMAAQRLLKAAGTYAHQVAVRGRTEFEAYLGPTLARARAELLAWAGPNPLSDLLELELRRMSPGLDLTL